MAIRNFERFQHILGDLNVYMPVQGYEPAQEKKETEEKVPVSQLWLTLEVRNES